MPAKDRDRLDRFWIRINLLLSQLTGEQLQHLLDGMDLIWANTWGLVDTRPVVLSAFQPRTFSLSDSPHRVRQVQEKLRAMVRSCIEHPEAVNRLLKSFRLLELLASQDVDVVSLLHTTLYDVDLEQGSSYQLLRACEFRSVAPDILEGLCHPLNSTPSGRYSFLLVPSEHSGCVESEVQVQDMGGTVANLIQLLHFARQHSDLGDQSLVVVAPAVPWISRSRKVEVCSAMTYTDGERHLITLPVKDVNCLGSTTRILAWRKPGK